MPGHRFGPVSWDELCKKLTQLGFEGPHQGGKHPYMIKNGLVLTAPNPHKKEISVDLLKRIFKQADISRED